MIKYANGVEVEDDKDLLCKFCEVSAERWIPHWVKWTACVWFECPICHREMWSDNIVEVIREE